MDENTVEGPSSAENVGDGVEIAPPSQPAESSDSPESSASVGVGTPDAGDATGSSQAGEQSPAPDVTPIVGDHRRGWRGLFGRKKEPERLDSAVGDWLGAPDAGAPPTPEETTHPVAASVVPAAAGSTGAAVTPIEPTAPVDVPTAAEIPEAPLPVVQAPAPPPRHRGRPPLVPVWIWWAMAGTVFAIALIVLVVALRAQSTLVRVPTLTGLRAEVARERLKGAGLTLRVGDRRFSANAPLDTIVDQDPAPGAKVSEGGVVVVALSAGSETFAMPDLVGIGLDVAKKRLNARGLAYEVQTVSSDRPQGTVIETFPSPGVEVQTGSSVRLTVAAGGSTDSVLLPSDMTGKTFVIDPAPSSINGIDTTLDVARRLKALLEASGARVVMTRNQADSAAAVTTVARARKAREASGTALVAFSVTDTGRGGLTVVSVPATTQTEAFYIKSIGLSTAVLDALKQQFTGIASESSGGDAIITGTGIPAVRIQLGSTAVSADRITFTDPQWADNVARGVYKAVAGVYGAR